MEQIKGLNVVLLGRTGAGKSSTGNTILGREAFVSKKSSRSVTRDVAVQSGSVGPFPVTVYDTPGLFDTEMSEEEIQRKYKEVLQRCESGPCMFLLVIKADRFTAEERKTVEKIEQLLGDERLKKTWILFTKGDDLEEENMTIQEFLDDTEALKNLVQKYDQRYHVFNNKTKKQAGQVQELFRKIFKPHLGEVLETLKQNPLTRKTPQEIEPDAPADRRSSRRLVLVGKSGVGKSAAGNTILGQREFDSVMRMSSVTSECSKEHVTVSGRSVSVVDTPGFFDTQMNPEDLAKEIARSVYISSPGPHAFLIVFPVNMRFTEHEQQIPQRIEMMFGEEVLKYSFILFTHGDQLDGESVKELIEQNCRLRDLVQKCGDRYHVFNNKDLNNREQVNDLLQKIDSMIEQNGGGHYSNQMFEDAQRFRREEEEQRQREEEQRQREEEQRKQQEEEQIQEEIERVKKETEERVRAEIQAERSKLERHGAEKQRDEEQRKQQENKQIQEEVERVRKETEERVRAEYEAERSELERLRAEKQREKKEDGFMQFFSRHRRFFLWGAVVVGVAFGGAALGALGGAAAAKALGGAAVAEALSFAFGGVAGGVAAGAAAGAVAGAASGEGAAKGAAAGAAVGFVAGAAVAGAVGGAYVGLAAAKACGETTVGGVIGGTVGGVIGGTAGGATAGAAAGAVAGAASGEGAAKGAAAGAVAGAVVGAAAGGAVAGGVTGLAVASKTAVAKALSFAVGGVAGGAAAGAVAGAASGEGAAKGAAGGAVVGGAVVGGALVGGGLVGGGLVGGGLGVAVGGIVGGGAVGAAAGAVAKTDG